MPVLQWTEAGAGLEFGNYSCEITEVIEENGEYGVQLRFQFVTLDDEDQKGDGEIRGWASAKWGEKTKLYRWAKSILGKRCPPPNSPLDTDKLVGKKCDIVVGPNAKGTGSKVEEVFPFRTVNVVGYDDDEAKPH